MIAASERETVVRLCRDLAARGFFAATGGNLALRVDETTFVVTPSALDYQAMTAVDVCVLRLADLKRLAGDRAPSVESGLHARVLRRRRDCACSIHTHQPAASACAVIGAPLSVVDPEFRAILGATIPIVGYAPSGTGWLAGKLESGPAPGRRRLSHAQSRRLVLRRRTRRRDPAGPRARIVLPWLLARAHRRPSAGRRGPRARSSA